MQARFCSCTARQRRAGQSRSVWQHAGSPTLDGTQLVRLREVQVRHLGTPLEGNAHGSGKCWLRRREALSGQVCEFGTGTATCGFGGFVDGLFESDGLGSTGRSQGVRWPAVGDRRPSTAPRRRPVRAARLQAVALPVGDDMWLPRARRSRLTPGRGEAFFWGSRFQASLTVSFPGLRMRRGVRVPDVEETRCAGFRNYTSFLDEFEEARNELER